MLQAAVTGAVPAQTKGSMDEILHSSYAANGIVAGMALDVLASGNSLESEKKIPTWASRHYSVHEIAALWNLSHDSVTRMFRNEPGVLAITPKKRRGMRTRTTLRIPEYGAERVYERITRKAA